MSKEKKIFISQQVLDAIFEQGKAELDGDTLIIHSKEKQIFKLVPAYKFLFLVEGEKDPYNLVGKIFTEQDLKKAKADIYMDSVLYKEVAYQVEPGFLGIPQTPKAKESAEKLEQADEVKALEEYLLKIL